MTMLAELKRPSPEALLAKLKVGDKATLRVYIGAAPGVGKTWQMLEDAHALKREGVDIVVAVLETHGRAETAALADGLERLPMRAIEYRGVTLEEMDVDGVIARERRWSHRSRSSTSWPTQTFPVRRIANGTKMFSNF